MAVMQIYLHKILPVFLLPVGITLILVMAGLLFRRRSFIWFGLAVLWLSSTPLVSDLLVRSAETWAERRLAIDAPRVDAIVVLSGGRVVAPGVAAVSEWGDANRFFGGVELFKAKSRLTTGAVVNTAEEAEAVAALLLQRSFVDTGRGAHPHVLLVTSALHMVRAQGLFERAGLEVTPFPVDFKVSAGSELGILDFP
jgi:uncharacterized SAM-binding protein YcdF (DUF218 family)